MTKTKTHLNRVGNSAFTQKLLAVVTTAGMAAGMTVHASADYGPAIWRPAYSGHWYTTGYGKKFFVEHDIEGYYWSCIYYFQQSATQASVHYTINGKKDNSSDANPGEVTQMVSDAYYAWHAACWNQHSMGTEHEGFVSNPAWFTPEMYQASASLTRAKADKYGFTKDRNRIVGHNEKLTPGWAAWAGPNLGINATCNTHTDPGPYWDWNGYMALINPANPGAGTHEYIGALNQDGSFIVKEGAGGTWLTEATGASAFQITGNRLGYLAYNGTFHVKEGLTAPWTVLTTGVAKFQLWGNRIAVLTTGGTLMAKDGIGGTWTTLATEVSAFQIDGNRIGAVSNGSLSIKDGMGGVWTVVATGAAKFQLWSSRIGVLTTSGTLIAKDSVGGAWSTLATGVSAFQLEGDRIGALSNGSFSVKEGLGGVWTVLTTDVAKFQLCGNRIGAQTTSGTLMAKDGVGGAWVTLSTGVSTFQLDGDRIGVLNGGNLNLKYGMTGIWTLQTGPTVASFQLATWIEGSPGGSSSIPPVSGAAATEVISDNGAAGFSVVGTWSTGTTATDKYGVDYRYRSAAAVDQPATWTGNLTAAGNYQILAWWSQGSNRSASAPYIVYHASGSSTVNKNQQTGGGSWQSLGTFNLNSGNNSVKLSCWTTTGFIVMADAVRWLPQ